MRTSTRIGITIPEDILTSIDSLRGDINRSRYILRLIEDGVRYREKSKK